MNVNAMITVDPDKLGLLPAAYGTIKSSDSRFDAGERLGEQRGLLIAMCSLLCELIKLAALGLELPTCASN